MNIAAASHGEYCELPVRQFRSSLSVSVPSSLLLIGYDEPQTLPYSINSFGQLVLTGYKTNTAYMAMLFLVSAVIWMR